MKMLIVTDRFYPLKDVNISCLEEILIELNKRFDLDIIANEYDFKLRENEILNGFNIIRHNSKIDISWIVYQLDPHTK